MQRASQFSRLPAPAERWTGAWITIATTALYALWWWLAAGPVAALGDRVYGGPIDAMGRRLYDSYFALRGPVAAPESVVIVAIDEASIRQVGHWPWSRRQVEALVRRLDEAGAALLVFDIVWSEPQPGDAELAAAIAATGRSILPLAFSFAAGAQAIPSDADLERATLVRVEQPGRFTEYPPIHATGLLPPVAALRGAAQGLGSIQVFPDPDGIFRWEPLVIEYDGALFPSLGVAAAAAYLGLWVEDVELVAAEGLTLTESHRVDTDPWGRALIPYYGAGGSFRYYSAAQVLSGQVGADQLAGRVVMVGASAVGLHDQISTPMAALMPGVEKQATMAAALIEGTGITRTPAWVELAALLLVGLLVGLASARPGVWGALAAYLFAIAASLIAGYALFRWGRTWFDVSYLVANLFTALLLVSAYKYLSEQRLARRIKGLFSSYVHQEIVDELIRRPESARLGGGRRQVTILFSDIRGFTGFSQSRSPEQVVARLNEYLSAMAEVIFGHQGTLDKFVGDAIMAFWGAPVQQSDHALRAVRCALDMLAGLERLSEDWQRRGEPPFACGIGIDSGEVLVGNIGAQGRKMDYTVIGDHVNLASRVEGLTKEYRQPLLVTGNLVAALRALPGGMPADIGIEPVGHTRVRGRDEVVQLFRCYRPTDPAG